MARSRSTSQLAILAVLGLVLVTQCAARQQQQPRRVLLEANATTAKTDAKSSNSTKSTAELAGDFMISPSRVCTSIPGSSETQIGPRQW